MNLSSAEIVLTGYLKNLFYRLGPPMKTLLNSDLLGRDNNLNLIRFAAAIAVIWGHSFALVETQMRDPVSTIALGHTYSGTIAVSMFFALSGFLVARSYYLNPDLAGWLRMRAARIYPGAIVCIFVILFYIFALQGFSLDFWGNRSVINFIQTNSSLTKIKFDIGEPVFPDNRVPNSLLGSWWTLPGEIHAYLLFAAIAVVGAASIKGVDKEKLRNIVAGIVVFALLAFGFFDHTGLPIIPDHPSYVYPTRYFLLGILCFLLRRYIVLDFRLFVALLFLPYISYSSKEGFLMLLMLPTTYSVFYIGYGLKNIGFDRMIGDWSYGIYIYGWFAQQVVASFDPAQSPYFNFLFGSLLATVLGAISWKLIERPSLAFARRLKPRRIQTEARNKE